MIYLIESVWHDKEADKIIDLVKIGYTGDFKKRWTLYKLHNPLCKIINSIEDGTEDDERKLHYYFKDLIYPDYGREWFTFDQSILDFFNTHKTSESLSSLPLPPPKEEEPLTDEMILGEWIKENSESLSDSVRNWLDLYLKERQFVKRLKSFCELAEEDRDFLLEKLPIELPFKNYYQTLGPARCKAVGYTKGNWRKSWNYLNLTKGTLREN